MSNQRKQLGTIRNSDYFYAECIQEVMERWCDKIEPQAIVDLARFLIQFSIEEKKDVFEGDNRVTMFAGSYINYPLFFSELLHAIERHHNQPKSTRVADRIVMWSYLRTKHGPLLNKEIADEVGAELGCIVTEEVVRTALKRERARRKEVLTRWQNRLPNVTKPPLKVSRSV